MKYSLKCTPALVSLVKERQLQGSIVPKVVFYPRISSHAGQPKKPETDSNFNESLRNLGLLHTSILNQSLSL